MADASFSDRAHQIAEGLFPHQVEGVTFLLGRRRAILADDMGLGKTRQAIVALSEMEAEGPYLVICPASVKRNWAREIEVVKPGVEVVVVGPDDPPKQDWSGWVIVNYDILKKHLDQLVTFDWTGMIFDEAHYLKNHTSQRSKLARQLVGSASDPVVYALTGTPLTNRPRDLFPLLQLANHPMGRSFLSFAKEYCDAYQNGYGWVTDGASNLEELTLQLRGVMLRRNKNEVLDLPPKMRTYLDVAVPDKTAVKETVKAFEILLQGRDAQRHGRESVGQSGSDRARLLATLTTLRRKIAVAKTKTTIEFVQNALDQGEKVLVFSCFDAPLQKIHAHFDEASVLLTGATPSKKRQELVDRFQDDDVVRVFVANIQAGGVGLNLTAARQVVFNDLDWVPANHWQAEDRAYRIGQTGTVQVSYMVAQDTIDGFVQTVLRTKAALVDNVIEGKALDLVAGDDVLGELERLMGELSPKLAEAPGGLSREEIRELLQKAQERYMDDQNDVNGLVDPEEKYLIPEDAIEALINVLSGPQAVKYRVESRSKSRKGTYYEITVEGSDLICSCVGFEYRGMCSHTRDLKKALASGGALPAGVTKMDG